MVDKRTSLLKNKKFTAVELTQAYLENMAAGKRYNAYVTECADKALSQAVEADKHYAAGDNRKLEGIPLGVKDLFCTKDIRTTACSHILDNFIPPYESTVTSKLLNDGAVFLGKLHCPCHRTNSFLQDTSEQSLLPKFITAKVFYQQMPQIHHSCIG